jgi:site-specific DNA-methyltransferase (adenine-specific)
MTPYYSRDGIVLFHADCRDVLGGMEAGSVQAVVTDPPFGEKTHNGARTRTIGANSNTLVSFDSLSEAAAVELFRLLVVVAERWVIATCEWRHAARFESAGLPVVRLGVWIKPNSAPQLTGDRPATGWEAVVILHREGRKRWNGGGKRAVWNYPRVDADLHPTQKPLPLIEEWVSDFTDEGDTILDPFAGSGTTLVAAWNLGRKAIGIEIDEKYAEIAAKRLDRVISQGRLFSPKELAATQRELFNEST